MQRQANARRDDERLLLDDERRAHCLDDLAGYDQGHLGPRQGTHDHGELVATRPSSHIGGPKGLRQSSRKRSQQRQSVGCLMIGSGLDIRVLAPRCRVATRRRMRSGDQRKHSHPSRHMSDGLTG